MLLYLRLGFHLFCVHKRCGNGFEQFGLVLDSIDGGFGGNTPAPDEHRLFPGRAADPFPRGNNELVLVEDDDRGGVRNCELMQGFNQCAELHAEKECSGVINALENLL